MAVAFLAQGQIKSPCAYSCTCSHMHVPIGGHRKSQDISWKPEGVLVRRRGVIMVFSGWREKRSDCSSSNGSSTATYMHEAAAAGEDPTSQCACTTAIDILGGIGSGAAEKAAAQEAVQGKYGGTVTQTAVVRGWR